METIKNYLDNMFANLPKTEQMIKLKNDLLMNMEEKYNELKNKGKSENEAIGIVISEFGNIDELVEELGIRYDKEDNTLKSLSQKEVDDFMIAKKASGILVGIGTSLCIMAAAMLILVSSLIDDNVIFKNVSTSNADTLGLIPLFIMAVPAVALFIYSGMKLEKYKYLKEGFDLPLNVKTLVEQKYSVFSSTYMVSLIIAVCLCVLSPIAIFIASALHDNQSNYGVVVLLTMVSIAVFIFIYFGTIKSSFNTLLKTEQQIKATEEDDKFVRAVSAILWPSVVCIFLITGLVFGQWGINWIIFPIAGILFGAFRSFHKITKE